MSRPWKEFWYRLEAYQWWCQDEVCDCYQAVIELVYPNLKAGYPWIRRVRQWEGTFHSEPDHEEFNNQERQLIGASWWFGIPLERGLVGEVNGDIEISKEYGKLLLANPMETR